METPLPDLQDILKRLVGGETLSEADAEQVFERILAGQADDAQIGALLAVTAARTPTVDELVGGARALRRHVVRVVPPIAARSDRCSLATQDTDRPRTAIGGTPPAPTPTLIDTCGTGGAPKAFNVSTAAAIVAAAAAPGRIMVAKHGGRSRTGRGSAEVLAHLGVNVDASPGVQARCLAEIGVCFSFAVNHHPAMRHAAQARRSLGFPTIFNLLGPLANPAGAPRQLIGTYSQEVASRLAQALARLGTELALVVTSRDGLDELTVTDLNSLFVVHAGRVTMSTLDASTLGLARASLDDLRVDDLDSAASLVRAVLTGDTGARRDMVVLNAAGALFVAGLVPSIQTGLGLAQDAIDSGRAAGVLAELARLSHTTAP